MQAHTLGEVGIRHSFVKSLFQDSHSNFYRNWFIFGRHGAKGKLAFFLIHGGVSMSFNKLVLSVVCTVLCKITKNCQF